MITLSTQILLPLLLLGWLLFLPAAGWLAWVLQALAIAAVLFGLSLAMLWAMPPYWMPWLYWLLFILIVSTQLWRGAANGSGVWSAGLVHSLALMGLAALGLVGAWLGFSALQGRKPPETQAVDIAAPFPAGLYLVAHGGSTGTVNAHLRTLDTELARLRNYRGQSRALDVFRITPLGFHVRGLRPQDPDRYVSFGTPLLAPCSGRVARVVDDVPDNQVPVMNREQMAGNYVAIDCDGFHIIMAHFRQASIGVSEGQAVEAGDVLGELGNSGNSSEPHLHIHAQRGLPDDAPLGGEPLALTIGGRFPVRNERIHVRD